MLMLLKRGDMNFLALFIYPRVLEVIVNLFSENIADLNFYHGPTFIYLFIICVLVVGYFHEPFNTPPEFVRTIEKYFEKTVPEQKIHALFIMRDMVDVQPVS